MNNLHVNFIEKPWFNKKVIHNSVSFLKKNQNFKLKELIINFVNKDEITRINTEFLHHQFSTDIITFNYSETKSVLDGEIYISIDDALQNAALFGSEPGEEIIRLVTHGILHILGYNDEQKRDKRIMKKLEDELVLQQRHIWLNEL